MDNNAHRHTTNNTHRLQIILSRVHSVLERTDILKELFNVLSVVDHVNVHHVVGTHESSRIHDLQEVLLRLDAVEFQMCDLTRKEWTLVSQRVPVLCFSDSNGEI